MFRERGAASPARLSLSLLFVLDSWTFFLRAARLRQSFRCFWRIGLCCRRRFRRVLVGGQLQLRLRDCATGIVVGIVFVIATIVGNSPHHLFRAVPPCPLPL